MPSESTAKSGRGRTARKMTKVATNCERPKVAARRASNPATVVIFASAARLSRPSPAALSLAIPGTTRFIPLHVNLSSTGITFLLYPPVWQVCAFLGTPYRRCSLWRPIRKVNRVIFSDYTKIFSGTFVWMQWGVDAKQWMQSMRMQNTTCVSVQSKCLHKLHCTTIIHKLYLAHANTQSALLDA